LSAIEAHFLAYFLHALKFFSLRPVSVLKPGGLDDKLLPDSRNALKS